MATMVDSTAAADALAVPADMYAGYVDGRFQNVDALRAAGKPVATITVFGGTDADVIDVEPGCVWPPANAVPWVVRMRAQGRDPVVYCGRANWATVIAAFNAADVAQPHYWIAHYTNQSHLCFDGCYPSSVGGLTAAATQYGGDLVGHYDISTVSDAWPSGLHTDTSGAVLLQEDVLNDDDKAWITAQLSGIKGAARFDAIHIIDYPDQPPSGRAGWVAVDMGRGYVHVDGDTHSMLVRHGMYQPGAPRDVFPPEYDWYISGGGSIDAQVLAALTAITDPTGGALVRLADIQSKLTAPAADPATPTDPAADGQRQAALDAINQLRDTFTTLGQELGKTTGAAA